MTQFNSATGVLEGPALIERANGDVEVGNYKKNRQHGIWRVKQLDGSSNTIIYDMGKLVKKSYTERKEESVISRAGTVNSNTNLSEKLR